ncbi:uncharacterized protein LOC128727143 [Anopheles nili]|uniref:uncharacterized protein LOC128727143 n=1 Tax=Anopheles nili TaxID=185578 RepID=UPI00237A10AD|nr:uncharacterized protein LOC128727143 [Anopheles nili]
MFRKPKQTIAPLPKPPTEAQMLEDLQLFHETRPPMKHAVDETIPTLSEESSMDDWWKTFEISLQHHEQFQSLMSNVDLLKKTLQQTQDELQAACEEIQSQIDQDLEKLRATMKD